MILVVERIGWNEEWVKRRAYDRKVVAERRWEAVKYVRSAEEREANGGVVGRVGRFLVGVLRLKAEEEGEGGNTAC